MSDAGAVPLRKGVRAGVRPRDRNLGLRDDAELVLRGFLVAWVLCFVVGGRFASIPPTGLETLSPVWNATFFFFSFAKVTGGD